MQTTNLIEQRLSYFLQRVGAPSLKELTFDQRKKVFLLAVKDFVDGTFSSDDLSAICSKIHLVPIDLKDDQEIQLNDAIYAGSELDFYIRKIDGSSKVNQFSSFMFEVMDYFKKHFPF